MAPPILELLRQYRVALATQDAQNMTRIMAAYKAMYGRITPLIEALSQTVSKGTYTAAQVAKLAQYISLQKAINTELSQFAIYMKMDISPTALAAAKLAELDANNILKVLALGKGAISVPFDRIPMEAVLKMLTFLDPNGALFQRLEQLAPYYGQKVADAILDAIAMGVNPKQTARMMLLAAENAFGGGLVDALRTARTVQLWAYREASRANYAANSDVVTGWVWMAELDDLTCEACIAEHGQEHGLDESLDGHYNCRCVAVPMVMGQNPVDNMQTGEAWFNELSEEQQRGIMGDTKYDAWKEGRFNFSDLSMNTPNDVYGNMKTVTPLKDLIGDE